MTKREKIQRKSIGNPTGDWGTVNKRGEIQRKPIGNPDRGPGNGDKKTIDPKVTHR